MRKCIKCGEVKKLELFRKRQIWFSHTCKLCYSKQYRTGKQNKGKFIKGHTPWIKGKKEVPRRLTPRYIKKGRPITNIPTKRAQWSLNVKKRDEFKCKVCGTEKDLHAHHIIKWKVDETKRFDINNGITLCRKCHSREERLLETAMGLPGCSKRKKVK